MGWLYHLTGLEQNFYKKSDFRITLIRNIYDNDTYTFKISPKQSKIISIFLKRGALSSSMVHVEINQQGESVALVTIKRMLAALVKIGILQMSGSGRATSYALGALGRLWSEVNIQTYCALEPDQRYGLRQYNFDLLPSLPSNLFSVAELKVLQNATAVYKNLASNLPEAVQKKELERLVIELAWKSSRIEGNTYTLLDTEKLILDNQTAPGRTKEETQMVLNHKDAFNFIRENKTCFRTLNRQNLEEVHAVLMKNLGAGRGLRKRPVGVLGSIYRPLDNIHQIIEALVILGQKVSRADSPYTQALMVFAGLAYIQPFEDGNKRMSRMIANAMLLAHDLAPLSYRSVKEEDYRAATLVWYELNSILALKKIFIEQYDFAARNYAAR